MMLTQANAPHKGMDDRIPSKLKLIKMLLLDVDGVLTQGEIIYDDRGVESKIFNVRDGLGLRLVMRAGIQVAVVTSRRSQALYRRCRDLDINFIFDGVKDKTAVLDLLLKKIPLRAENILFIGDDLPDIALMKRVGLAVAVADAGEPVRAVADLITTSPGGKGAVREICEHILKAKGLWEKSLELFQ